MTTPRVPQGPPERAAAPDAAAAVDQWVSVGPAAVVRGQATGRPRISGRVVALAVSADGQRIYAGTSLGGVWYSRDEGAHWTSLDFYSSARDAANALQHADALTVGAIAVKWGANAAADEVYVGSGEHPPFGAETAASLAAVGIRRAVGPAQAVEPVGAAFAGAAAADPWRVEATELAGVAVNQLAIDPMTDGVVWAATSRGLYRRAPGPPVQWTQINTTLDGEATAVVVFPGAVAGQQTVYVAVMGGRVARSADNGATWQPIALPPFPADEVVPATQVAAVRLTRGNVAGSTVVYALADGPRLWRIDGVAPVIVHRLPRAIGERIPESPQRLALALAVHPTADAAHRDVIAIGGLALAHPNAGRRQAALFTGHVTLDAGRYNFSQGAPVDGAPAEWIGRGMPPGVHVLEWVAPAAAAQTHLWAGGDGGAFRSTADGERGSFVERNTGLGAIEVTAFAQASDVDGVMIAATRANGLLGRRANETWEVIAHGPVGGVAIDPGNPRRMYAQQVGSAWRYTDDGGATPLNVLTFWIDNAARRAVWDAALDKEDKASAPVSRMTMIVAARSSRGTQRAFGTNRVWYTDDDLQLVARDAGGAATGWVTLPSRTNPYDPALPNAPLIDQDVLDKPVLAMEWGTEARLYVLTVDSLYLFERDANLAWTAPEKLYDAADVQRRQKLKTPRGQIPYELPRLAFAVHDAGSGKGTCYIGTGGASDRHHCWWFDGAGVWRDTGFAVDTPVRAIVVDPDHREVIYIATDRGVYQGVGNFPAGANPTWNWSLYGRGLPGAPCVDLAIYSPAGATTRLLRAALAGRGVWEVLLDGLQQGPEVYLRAHAYDSRRGEVPVGGIRNPHSASREQVPLDASPDIRVWRAPGAAPPEAIDYAIGPASDAYDIWRLLAGLRAAGDDVDPNEGWIAATTPPVVANRRAIVLAGLPGPFAPNDFWRLLLRDNPIPHDRTPHDHTDLAAYLRDEPDRWPKGFRTSCVSGDGTARIYVTVHSRHWRRVADNTVKVALLRTRFGRRHSLEGVSPLPAHWGADLVADLNVPGPRGLFSPAFLTIAGWEYVDPQNPFQQITGPFDPDNPQVVTFDASLRLGAGDTWNKPGWLLLAVVVVDGDPAPPTERNVARLVRTDRRVAARSVRRALLFARTGDRNAGMDISRYPSTPTMNIVWAESNIVLTGLYLSQVAMAPTENPSNPGVAPFQHPAFQSGSFESPVPAGRIPPAGAMWPGAPNPIVAPLLGAFRGHADASWMVVWNDLEPDVGTIPIYFGHQDPHNVDWEQGAQIGWRPKGPFDLRETIGFANALDAAAKATAANIPFGAVIYLDWEVDNLNWVLNGAAGNTVASASLYCLAFLRALPETGYRPGVYCRHAVSPLLRQEIPGLWVWNPRNANPAPPNLVTVEPKNGGTQLVLNTSTPFADPAPHTILRQWRLDFTLPAANPVPIAAAIDLNVANVHDGSFPERRMLAGSIIGGRLAAAHTTAGACAIYTVRRGRPLRAAGAAGAIVREPAGNLVPDAVKFQWNPYSVPAALRVSGPVAEPDPTDMMIALAYSPAEGDEVWRLQVLRRRVTAAGAPVPPWVHETLADSGYVIDPLSGVAAVSRGDRSVDVFAIVNASVTFVAHGTLAVSRRHPDTYAWATLTEIAGATARRTNRPAAISRDAGVANVFFVDANGHAMTSASDAVNPDTWSAPVRIGDPAVDVQVHPLSNLAAVARDANRMDVVFLGRVPPAPLPAGAAVVAGVWRLYNVWWTTAGGWAPANSRIADNGAVTLEPLSPIAACLRDAGHLDVFTVGRDGGLYVTTLDYAAGVWAGPVLVGALLAGINRLSSVDSACSDGNGSVQVIVSSRDGNVWATSWNAAAGAYRPLASLAAVLPL